MNQESMNQVGIELPYLIFVPGSAGVKCSAWCQTKYERVCFGVKILDFVFFGVKKSGISAFLVSAENGAGSKKLQISRMHISLYDVSALKESPIIISKFHLN